MIYPTTLSNILGVLFILPVAGLLLWLIFCTGLHLYQTTKFGRWCFVGALFSFASAPIICMGHNRFLSTIAATNAGLIGVYFLAAFFAED